MSFWSFTPAGRLSAQLLNAAAPIRVGHYHLNVTSIDEHKKFWVDAMGGTATKVGSTEAVRFGDVFLLLRQQKPTGADARDDVRPHRLCCAERARVRETGHVKGLRADRRP